MTETQKPNVIFFLSDDTSPDWLGPWGGDLPTPHLDRLAATGTRFNRFYCTSSFCTPSRYSFLTGQYPGRCNDALFLKENPVTDPYMIGFNTYLNASIPSFGNVFKRNGYRTGFAGKWHVGYPYEAMDIPEFDREADPYDPEVSQALATLQKRFCDDVRERGGYDFAGGVIWGNNEEQPLEALRYHHPEFSMAAALEFLDGCEQGKPFALHYATTCFHGPSIRATMERDPRVTPGGVVDGFPDAIPRRKDIVEELKAGAEGDSTRQLSMRWIEEELGLLLRKLEAMGELENTIIVYSSDHNTQPGKGTCWEEGLHIPLIIRFPQKVKQNHVVEMEAQNIDLFPTLLNLCDIEVPDDAQLDGRSLLPSLQGETQVAREALYFEIGYFRCVRTAEWKYQTLRYPQHLIDDMESGRRKEAPNHMNKRLHPQACIAVDHYASYFDSEQLYAYREPEGEQRNLAHEDAYSPVRDEMRGHLKTHLDSFEHRYDLEDTEFLDSPRFKELAQATQAIGIDHISWLREKNW